MAMLFETGMSSEQDGTAIGRLGRAMFYLATAYLAGHR